MQRTRNVIRSVTAGKNNPPLPAFVAIIYASCFFVTRWWLPMMSERRRVQCGHWRRGGGRALACSPSLNSPRSNLQTAAEFWQILPRCLLPLGDTFFIYFSSPPLWYSLHGALDPQAIVSSVLLPCLKNQMDLQGLLSTPPFTGLMNVAQPSISTLYFLHCLILNDDLVMLGIGGGPGCTLSWHDFRMWHHNMSWPAHGPGSK